MLVMSLFVILFAVAARKYQNMKLMRACTTCGKDANTTTQTYTDPETGNTLRYNQYS